MKGQSDLIDLHTLIPYVVLTSFVIYLITLLHKVGVLENISITICLALILQISDTKFTLSFAN